MNVKRVVISIEPSFVNNRSIEVAISVVEQNREIIQERIIILDSDFPSRLSLYLKLACNKIEDFYTQRINEEIKKETIVDGLRKHGEMFIIGEMEKKEDFQK